MDPLALSPNKSLERTREDKVPSSNVGVRDAQLNRQAPPGNRMSSSSVELWQSFINAFVSLHNGMHHCWVVKRGKYRDSIRFQTRICASVRKVALLLILSISTASAGEVPSSHQVSDIPAGHGIVYLYRPKQFANKMIKPGIIVDRREYPMLPGGKFLRFVLSEGAHVFALKLSDTYEGDAAGQIQVVAGATTYLRLDTSNQDIDDRTFKRVFRFKTVLADEGVSQIVECKMIDLEKGKRYRKSFIMDN